MNDFRFYLQEELITRCRNNPRYSLRSFARALGMNHGVLSMILRNKRPLTVEMIQKIGLALKLDDKKLHSFMELRTSKAKKMNQMTVDVFNIVSEWYHDAILELSRVHGFKPSPDYISKRLGITLFEARAAIERLIRVGLVEVGSTGHWVETLGDNTTAVNVDFTNAALRSLQKQVLNRSMHALENVPKQHRDHACTTMAINTLDLHEAKERIKKFRHELMSFLQRNGTQYDEVYQLAVSIYPLTKLNKGESNEN